jgi:hypothetical protein
MEVLDLRSLKMLNRVLVTTGWGGVTAYAISPDGRLALFEYAETETEARLARLVVRDIDGTEVYTRRLRKPIKAATWSMDGKVLVYLDPARGQIVRLEP